MPPSPAISRVLAKLQNSSAFNLFCRWFLGGIFLYASIEKILHPRDFALAIENYHLLPSSYILPLALILPWLEALGGLFLILGIFTRASAWLLLTLLLVFIGALTSALIRGLDISCGCFDLKDKPLGKREIYLYISRDFIFLFFACWIIKIPFSRFSLANILPPQIKKLAD